VQDGNSDIYLFISTEVYKKDIKKKQFNKTKTWWIEYAQGVKTP
jgi:hypothetical protein